jgi:hypothetical protein
MRFPIVFLSSLVLFPGAALAQESVVERLLALSRQSNSECQRQQLPQPALGAACQSARSYDDALARLGFCFDAEMGEWGSCTLANRSRPPQTAPAPQTYAPPPAPETDLPDGSVQSYSVPSPDPDEDAQAEPELELEPGIEPEISQTEPDPAPDLAPVTPPVPETYAPPEPEVELEPSETGWRTYSNGRFGTVVEIPPGFEPRTAVENGDGQTFASADGESEVAVYGSLLENQSMRQYRDWYRQELSGKSYEAGGGNWFVISGTAEGKIYYVKVLRTAHCGVPVVHHMVFRYPSSQKRRFDPVVEQLADSLQASRESSICEG